MAYSPSEIVTANKTVTMAGVGDTLISLFSLTGIVRVHEIYGVVTETTEATVLQKVGLVLYEATPTTVEITDITLGTDCSATVVGSLLIRTGVVGATTAIAHQKANVCSVNEMQYDGSGYGLVLVQRGGVATYIKTEFTGAAETDVDIQWFVKYTPLSAGSSIVAV